MNRQANNTPPNPAYRIIPTGPAVVIINEYSSLHRIVIPSTNGHTPPPARLKP